MPAEALWVAVAASKGTSCKNRCMLWPPPAGTIKMLNSASQLCSIGGDAVTDAERNGAREALTIREKEARAGVLGGRGKKRGDEEEAAERLPVSTRKVAKPTAVAAAVAHTRTHARTHAHTHAHAHTQMYTSPHAHPDCTCEPLRNCTFIRL